MLGMPSKFSTQSCRFAAINGVGFLGSVISPEFMADTGNEDSAPPTAGVSTPSGSLKSAPRIYVSARISEILRSSSGSQIFKSIIRLVTIFVVNIFRGPRAGHEKPCQTMAPIFASIYPYAQIAVTTFRACLIAHFCPSSAEFFPYKNSGFRIITQKFRNPFKCWSRHDLPAFLLKV
jgi:hypothetical protein